MIDTTNNSPPNPVTQEPTGQSGRASEARSGSLSLTPEELETFPDSELIRLLKGRLKNPKGITERECVQIGDALRAMKAMLSAQEYHSSLREMRLTPVAAWDYQAISQNSLLRDAIVECELPANPNELAVLAKLPDMILDEILAADGMVEPSEFATKVIRQIREDVVINAGSRFGWPQIAIRQGETWTVTMIPTKMGAQGTFFTRVGLHSVLDPDGSSMICPRTTDAKLGGNPASSCPFCGEIVNHEQNVLSGSECYDPVPYWATYCIVHQITNTEGEVPYFHDPSEPFLFILNEKMLSSVVEASLETADEGFFGTLELSLDKGLQLLCKWTDPQDLEDIQKWSARLVEPAQLCVAARQFAVYRAAPSIHLY